MDERINEALRQALEEYERATNKREARLKIMGLLLLIERAANAQQSDKDPKEDVDRTNAAEAGPAIEPRKPPHCSIRAERLDLSASSVRLGFMAHKQRALASTHL